MSAIRLGGTGRSRLQDSKTSPRNLSRPPSEFHRLVSPKQGFDRLAHRAKPFWTAVILHRFYYRTSESFDRSQKCLSRAFSPQNPDGAIQGLKPLAKLFCAFSAIRLPRYRGRVALVGRDSVTLKPPPRTASRLPSEFHRLVSPKQGSDRLTHRAKPFWTAVILHRFHYRISDIQRKLILYLR